MVAKPRSSTNSSIILSFPIRLLNNPSLHNAHLLHWPILRPRPHQPHAPYNLHAALHAPKHGMLAVEPRRGRERDEELAAVFVLARIRHAQHARARVPQRRVDLVRKRAAPARLAAAPRAGRVAALDHEGRDDAVEDGAVVVAALH